MQNEKFDIINLRKYNFQIEKTKFANGESFDKEETSKIYRTFEEYERIMVHWE